jgi:cobalt/nickel transport system ATP-binding protein|uniref:ABC transporter ATP-binding protein n=1 Tax=Desulfobacca acetoxidans TaxID=60893 RepID=A0A7V6A1Q0_9BACT
MMTQPILALQDVSFTYPDGSRGLTHCTLEVARGSRTAILGDNGAGKTTLCLHLNGILRPQSGQVLWNGSPLDYSRRGLKQLRSRVGLVFQNPDAQLLSASVREDVSFGPMNLGWDHGIIRERVEKSLAAVGLSELAEKPVHNLSFGQKKRVCLAGVLAMQPEVIILDEPFSSLDVGMRRDLHSILESLSAAGITVLICSHDLDFAYEWADRWHIIEAGQLAASYGMAEVPQVFTHLTALGLGIPKVAELYQELVNAEVLPPFTASPRSHADLLLLIRQLRNAVHRNTGRSR